VAIAIEERISGSGDEAEDTIALEQDDSDACVVAQYTQS
jgi:hypothetical protein